MNLAVLLKQVADVTFPFDLQPETCVPREEDLFYVLGPADLSAIRCALELTEKHGGQVCYVSCGAGRVRNALVAALTYGGGRAVHVLEDGPESSPLTKARTLARVLKPLASDLILCGTHSLDQGSGETPAALAEILDLPQVTGVVAVEIGAGGRRAVVERCLERGRRQTVETELPALLTVSAALGAPRYASLPGFLEAHTGARISRIDGAALGAREGGPALLERQPRFAGFSLPRPRPKKTFEIPASLNAEERLDLIMSGGIRKRTTGRFLEGDPARVAEQLGSILLEASGRSRLRMKKESP